MLRRVRRTRLEAWATYMASPFETAPSAPPRGEGLGHIMKPLLGDLPFKNSRRVYLAIKLAVLALGVLLALHFLWGVV